MISLASDCVQRAQSRHTVQVKKRKKELSQYETIDCGKPIVEAEADMVKTYNLDRLFWLQEFSCSAFIHTASRVC